MRATLTYELYLAAEKGIHHLPLEAPVSSVGKDRGAEFHVSIHHSDGVAEAWGTPEGVSQRHDGGFRLRSTSGPRTDAQPTSFTASYALVQTGRAGSIVVWVQDGVGYFGHRLRAPMTQKDLPLDLVLVLDGSSSLRGEKSRQMKEAALQLLAALRDGDRLHIVVFGASADSAWTGL